MRTHARDGMSLYGSSGSRSNCQSDGGHQICPEIAAAR
jgi:hypothetical protein